MNNEAIIERNWLSSRRAVLLRTAPAAAAAIAGGSLASCSGQRAQDITSTVIDAVQAVVATTCSFVPNVQTLLSILADFPGIGGVASISNQLLTEVADFLCKSFAASGGVPAAAAGKPLNAKLKSGATVGVHGLVFVNGQFKTF